MLQAGLHARSGCARDILRRSPSDIADALNYNDMIRRYGHIGSEVAGDIETKGDRVLEQCETWSQWWKDVRLSVISLNTKALWDHWQPGTYNDDEKLEQPHGRFCSRQTSFRAGKERI